LSAARLVKTLELYFLDTGLAASLLEIENEIQLRNHPLRGALFETFVISELLKYRFNAVKKNNVYFFRDNIGNEVDVLLDFGTQIRPVEIKSSEKVSDDFFKGLHYYMKLNSTAAKNPSLIYAGNHEYKEQGCTILPPYSIPTLLE